MIKFWASLCTLWVASLGLLTAQTADMRTLFSVENKPVTVEEFTYIYSKTNGEKADFSKESLQEYLDLYVKFKLKVQRAKDMRLDTIQSLKDELAGYRRQLADSYLIDRAIGDRLLQEAYAHLQEDVDISHILVALKTNPTPADTLAAYQRIMMAKESINKKVTFEMVAKDVSDDKYSKEKGGRIGYIPAPFPNGLYKLEYAAYTSPLNQLVGPIRTNAGYHLLVVHARRPARGEVEAAHIMVRNEGKTPEAAKARIDSVYQVLQGGAAFDALAKAVSEDRRTAENGGYVGFFGVNRYEQPFEDVAFGLANDNTFSQPFQTSLGWHVVKRISKKEIQPFAAEKPRLDARIRQDGRFEEAKRGLLDNIRKENNFMEQTALLNEFIASLPDTFTTFRWKAPATPDARVLFSIGKNFPVTLGEFATYMDKATRQRVSYAKEGDANYVARKLYDEFVDSQLLKYEETQLEDRYPEFKSLMREYEEGILLFEATKMEVWDKAAQDTVGLERFFNGAPGKYRWAPRASTTTYRIKLDYKDEAAAIREYARTHTPEEVKAKYNTEEVVKVTTDQSLVEKFRSTELGNNAWEAGALTELEENTRSKSINFIKVEEILPESNKTLHEARGYVIADYQDQLERQWVEDLRKRYAVSIDQKVFNSLVK